MAGFEELQRLLAENRKSIGDRAAEIPNIYKQFSPSTDPEVAQTRAAQAEKVKQLFQYDNQLAQTSFQPQAAPGPSPTGGAPTIPDPMIVDPTIGLRAANTQTMATAQEAIDLGQQITKRKDFLAESLEKALKLFQIGMQIKEAESAAIQGELDNWFKMQDLIDKRSTRGKGDAEKTKKQSYLAQILSGGEAGNLETLTQKQFNSWVNRIVAQNPQDAGMILEAANEARSQKTGGAMKEEEDAKRADAFQQWKILSSNAAQNYQPFPDFETWFSQNYGMPTSIPTLDDIGGLSESSAALNDPMGVR